MREVIDDKWIGITEGNIGQMRALAEYLNVHERVGIFEKLDGNAWLEISVMEGNLTDEV